MQQLGDYVMKPYRKFSPPKSLLEQIGEEYAGEYTIHVLNAKEYLQLIEDVTQAKRFEAQKAGKVWSGVLDDYSLRDAIIYKTVTKDNKPLPDTLPSKLYEILSFVAIPANMLTQEEGRQLLELFRPATEN